mmetsp:Transcript_21205/g.67749  ORF Transcript_21205/g.67749 Transcript_21205/m.67749 type:complete len:236 (+) Transcript_21205:1359-2066(+)
MPSKPLSGVRISCDMQARKWSFCSLERCSSRISRCFSSMRRRAITSSPMQTAPLGRPSSLSCGSADTCSSTCRPCTLDWIIISKHSTRSPLTALCSARNEASSVSTCSEGAPLARQRMEAPLMKSAGIEVSCETFWFQAVTTRRRSTAKMGALAVSTRSDSSRFLACSSSVFLYSWLCTNSYCFPSCRRYTRSTTMSANMMSSFRCESSRGGRGLRSMRQRVPMGWPSQTRARPA